jgi:cell division transport system ATP-binding protein
LRRGGRQQYRWDVSAIIQLHHVHKSYGTRVTALVDLTFDIAKGEFVYLTGPSGAGKSTLLRLIFRAEKPNAGQLLVGGRNTARLAKDAIPYLRRNIGVVFQDFKLLPRHTVLENVAIVLEVLNHPRKEIRRRALALLDQVGLAHKANVFPPALSGGEQQRVAVVRALAGDPQILLADEPTGNLDKESAQSVMRLLDHANARGTTVVVATHDEALLARGERRILCLEHGRLVA